MECTKIYREINMIIGKRIENIDEIESNHLAF